MEAEEMNKSLFFKEDLWAMILARTPLKSITRFKLVSKKWKSLIESKFFRQLFMSHNQNSHSSWSIICMNSHKELMAQYGSDCWGLTRSLGSYITSFLAETFKSHERVSVKVVAYSDVGFIMICFLSWTVLKETFYVANPVSRQCFKLPLPTLWFGLPEPAGLVARVDENEVVIDYKAVFVTSCEPDVITLRIYSSDTGLWSCNTLGTSLPLYSFNYANSICLNGTLYWIGYNRDHCEVLVSHDVYGTCTELKVITYPDVENYPNSTRACTSFRGSLMYMNFVSENKDDGRVEHKLSLWRLISEEWQFIYELSPDFIFPGFESIPLAINPFDCNTMYLWNKMYKCLLSTNLHKGNFKLHNNNLELSDDRYGNTIEDGSEISTYVLPRWLYRIPSSPAITKVENERKLHDQTEKAE